MYKPFLLLCIQVFYKQALEFNYAPINSNEVMPLQTQACKLNHSNSILMKLTPTHFKETSRA